MSTLLATSVARRLSQIPSLVAYSGKEEEGTANKSRRVFWFDVVSKSFRWCCIVAFFVLVFRGWFLSLTKYTSGQTSLSLIKNESSTFRFPSLTLCPMLKHGVELQTHVLGRNEPGSCLRLCGTNFDWRLPCQCHDGCVDNGNCCEDYHQLCLPENGTEASTPDDDPNLMLKDLDLERWLDAWTWRRQDFITFFTHSEEGKLEDSMDILDNDSYWTRSVPHVYHSGKCFTYDPKFDSRPGWQYGIRFGLRLPEHDEDRSEVRRGQMLKDMTYVFLHEKGKFAFSTQDDFPSSHKLDLSWLRFRHENSIDLNYNIYTAMDKAERPCSSDPAYDFNKCVDTKHSTWRGCQAPWHFFNDTGVRVCANVTRMKSDFGKGDAIAARNYDRVYQSPRAESHHTKCPLPCTTALIRPTYSYRIMNQNHELNWMTDGADWTVHVWFKNFAFTYETEYEVCDLTCLLGEVGGNLGFFLGGSILAFLDLIIEFGQKKMC